MVEGGGSPPAADVDAVGTAGAEATVADTHSVAGADCRRDRASCLRRPFLQPRVLLAVKTGAGEDAVGNTVLDGTAGFR